MKVYESICASRLTQANKYETEGRVVDQAQVCGNFGK